MDFFLINVKNVNLTETYHSFCVHLNYNIGMNLSLPADWLGKKQNKQQQTE